MHLAPSRNLAIRLCAALAVFSATQANQFVTAAADPPRRQAKEKAGTGPEEPKRIVRVYLIDDLVFTPGDYPYQGHLPTTGPFDKSESRSSLPGMRAGFGGGNGTGMGGGMAGMKMGALEMRGTQFGGIQRASQLVNLIKKLIKGEWEGDGDQLDQCIVFGNNLVVRQTEEGQRHIADLLLALRSGNAGRSVTIEATWVWLDAQKRESLRTAESTSHDSHQAGAFDPKRLRDLARDSAAFRGQITCLNGQTVHFATGQRRLVVPNVQATVGVGSSAYSPTVEIVNVGAVLQVTPTISRERHSAFLDLHSVVTQWGAPGEPFKVTSQSFSGSSEKSAHGILVQDMATVDRVNLGAQEWSTTASLSLGVPVLVGAVTLTAPAEPPSDASAGKRPELGLIVEVRTNE
jgi:hypothetical protein